eukprot:SAG11_NODE_27009_length_338_cov_0.861925_1_plen_112_part_11
MVCDSEKGTCSYTNIDQQLYVYDCLAGKTDAEKKQYAKLPSDKKYSFFDEDWIGDDYQKKREYFTMHPSFFTCEFNRTDDGIKMAGNHSFCCRVTFQNNSDVWAPSKCRKNH